MWLWLRDVREDEWDEYGELAGVGHVQQLNEYDCTNPKRIPLGFPIPQGDEVTPYRERLKAGEHTDKKTDDVVWGDKKQKPQTAKTPTKPTTKKP